MESIAFLEDPPMLFRRTPGVALLALSVIGLVLLDPHTSTGQPGGGGFGGKDRTGGKDRSGKNPFTDPETVFNFYAKGGDVIDFSRMDANMKAFAKSSFEKAGLPAPSDNTVITKAQFVDSFSRALAAKGITPGAPIGGGAPSGGGFGGEWLVPQPRSVTRRSALRVAIVKEPRWFQTRCGATTAIGGEARHSR